MANSDCQKACRAVYEKTVERLNNTLLENLILAEGKQEEKQKAKEKFSKGMKLAKEVLEICLGECDD
jgi:hypothetical protein